MTKFDSCSISENDQNYGTVTTQKCSSDLARPNTPVSDGEYQPLLSSSKLSSENQLDNKQETSTISLWSKLGFAVGHIHNDLFACLWFNYMLLFMTKVLKMAGSEAGALIMFGQIIYTTFTPVVGYLIDKYSTIQKWHFFGKFCFFFSLSPF